MDIKIATCVNSVRFRNFESYRFYDFVIELPPNHKLIELQLTRFHYVARTDRATLDLKPCARCKRILPISEFYKAVHSCKICHRILTSNWRKNNPEVAKISRKKHDKKYRYQKKLIAAGLK